MAFRLCAAMATMLALWSMEAEGQLRSDIPRKRQRRLGARKEGKPVKHDPDAAKNHAIASALQQQSSQIVQAQKQIQAAKGKRPRIVICCLRASDVQSFFPKYEPIDLRCGKGHDIDELIRKHNLNENDVLMGNLMQAEACVAGGILKFPGKQLYLNPEGMDEFRYTPRDPYHGKEVFEYNQDRAVRRQHDYLPPGDNVYVIGAHPDTSRSICISIGLYLLAVSRPEQVPKFVNVQMRPKNTKKYFMGYFQSHYLQFREEAFRHLASELSDLGVIHVGAKCQGNPQHPADERYCIPEPFGTDHSKRIQVEPPAPMVDGVKEFLKNDVVESDYRFVVVFENQYRDGYITEKLINAFLSGSIPIYWGSRKVLEIFNPKSFVYYDVNNPGPALEMIRRLETSWPLYESVLAQPILREGTNTTEAHMSFRPRIGKGKLRQRILNMMNL